MGERVWRWRRFFSFIFSLRSFLDLWKSDRRCSSKQKVKLVYVKRATHRYQYISIFSNVKM